MATSIALAEDDDSFDGKINAALTALAKGLDGKQGKVAIMDFPSQEGKINGLSSYISNRATNQWINSGREVVDRVTLEKVLREQKLQQSTLMDSKTAAKVGRLAGAKFLMLGNFVRLPRAMNVTLRILSVESAQFTSAQEVSIPMNGDNTELINDLVAKTGSESGNVSLEGVAPTSASVPTSAKVEPKKSAKKKVESEKIKSDESQQETE